jgi:hypothetical protein
MCEMARYMSRWIARFTSGMHTHLGRAPSSLTHFFFWGNTDSLLVVADFQEAQATVTAKPPPWKRHNMSHASPAYEGIQDDVHLPRRFYNEGHLRGFTRYSSVSCTIKRERNVCCITFLAIHFFTREGHDIRIGKYLCNYLILSSGK